MAHLRFLSLPSSRWSRRLLTGVLASTLGLGMLGFLGFGSFSAPVHAAEAPITMYTAGELPAPAHVKRLLSAGNPTDVVLLAVAPDELVGFAWLDMKGPKGAFFKEPLKSKPVLGRIVGRGSTLTDEKIVALKPDLIIDTGNLTPMYQDTAKRVFERTGIPYVLLDGSWEATPALLEKIGALTGNRKAGEKAAALARDIMASTHNTVKGSFFLVRGSKGLQTGQPGSIHTQALEWVGLTNVVPAATQGLTEVSLEQLIAWDPDYLITQDKAFYEWVTTNPTAAGLKAVKAKHVLLMPVMPFGWVDSPPTLNRLLGAAWVSHVLRGGTWEAFVPTLKRFYSTMYHIDLTDEDVKTLRQGVAF